MPTPRFRQSIERAANELRDLVQLVENDAGISDERLTAAATRGDALIGEICAARSLNLADALQKLQCWAATPASMWDVDCLVDSVIWDLRELIREEQDKKPVCAPKGWRGGKHQ